MHTCEYPNCGAEYPSALAAAECEETDRVEDDNTREWFSKYQDGRGRE